MGVDPEREPGVSRFASVLVAGRMPGPGEVAVGAALADKIGVAVGDEAVLVAPAADGSTGNDLFTVSGIYRLDLGGFDDSYALLELGTLQDFLVMDRGRIHEVAITVDRVRDADPVAERVAVAVAGLSPDLVTEPWSAFLGQLYFVVSLASAMNSIVAFLIFGMAIFGVANTMLLATFERRREFAVARALGTSGVALGRIVVYEGLLLGVVALAAGAALAFPLLAHVHAKSDRPERFRRHLFIHGLGDPAPADRRILLPGTAGERRGASGHRHRLGTAPGLAGGAPATRRRARRPMIRFPTLVWLALRNLGRELRRSALTAAAMTVGLALLILSRTLADGAHEDWIDSGVRLASGHVSFNAPGYRDSESLDHRLNAGQVRGVAGRRRPGPPGRALDHDRASGDARTRIVRRRRVAGADRGCGSSIRTRVLPARRRACHRALPAGGRPPASVHRNRNGHQARSAHRVENGADRAGWPRVTSRASSCASRERTAPDSDELDEALVHIPVSVARSWLGVEGATSVSMVLPHSAFTDPVLAEARAALEGSGIEVAGWPETARELYSAVRIDDAGDWVFHLILFAIVTLAILNAVFMSVLHRKRELGLLRSLGLSGAETGLVVFAEGVLLTVASGLLGVALGFALVWAFFRNGLDLTDIMPADITFGGIVFNPVMHPSIELTHLVQSVVLTTVIGLSASLYPAWHAARLDPAESVKVE